MASFELVDARGAVRTISAAAGDAPDLFWALRGGGGGTFGIVTSMTLASHPEANVHSGAASFNTSLAAYAVGGGDGGRTTLGRAADGESEAEDDEDSTRRRRRRALLDGIGAWHHGAVRPDGYSIVVPIANPYTPHVILPRRVAHGAARPRGRCVRFDGERHGRAEPRHRRTARPQGVETEW